MLFLHSLGSCASNLAELMHVQVLMGTAVKKLLRLTEAPLLELRVALEAGYLLPAVQRCISRLQGIEKCLSGTISSLSLMHSCFT